VEPPAVCVIRAERGKLRNDRKTAEGDGGERFPLRLMRAG